MFAYSQNIKLHYQITGERAGVALVFINSLGCDLTIWDEVVKLLRDEFHILRYDMRGHGGSSVPPGPYSLRDHSGDLAGLLDALEIREAVLIGISVGGLIAMDYALLRPAAVRALVLCDTAPRIGNIQFWSDRMHAIHEQGLESMTEAILSRWFTMDFAYSHIETYQNAVSMFLCMPLEGYIASCATLRDADLSKTIHSIKAPALVICGAADRVVTPTQTREWAARLPGARVEIIPGAAHLPCIEQPAALAQAIKTFIQEGGYA